MTTDRRSGELAGEAPDELHHGPEASLDQSAAQELLGLVKELDADNERLRMRVLELLELMEDSVTAQVGGERRIAELERRCGALEAELVAVRNTRVMRLSAPLRRAYGRLRALSSTTQHDSERGTETGHG